ncbi:SDR family oxidoreductase [Streptomyces sp. NPDC059582]|uniref:SDR family oxidoreductase n=1 Tax=Streptomyces sp. NPDC059582 TaxID=3346875 RepID=UPI0036A9C526
MSVLDGAVVLVTGANGGLGQHWVAQALHRGAARVYATDLRPGSWEDSRVVPVALDVTDEASVAALADRAQDVTLLINNAGIPQREPFLDVAEEALHRTFDVNFFGPLRMARHFAPALIRNGNGRIVNVISLLSWMAIAPGYSSTKAALWSMTNSLRLELEPRGVRVVAVHMGFTDTPMTLGLDVPKNDPADVVRAAFDVIESNGEEVLVDDWTRAVKAALAGPIRAMYPQLDGADLPFGQGQ